MSDHVHHVTTLQEYLELTHNYSCVVKITAPRWCGPCRMLAPKFEELAEKYGHQVKFLFVDIDVVPMVARHLMIRGVPRVLFYRNNLRQDNLAVDGFNPDLLQENVEIFVVSEDANPMITLAEDNIVESDDSVSQELSSHESSSHELSSHESSSHDLSNEDSNSAEELPIEKTFEL